MSPEETLPPERLMKAVDAIYTAHHELGQAGFDAVPSKLIGRLTQPRAFCDFSRHEICEAERFLMRCGLLEVIPDRPEPNC